MEITSGVLLTILGGIAFVMLVLLVLGVPRTRRQWTGAISRGVEAVALSLVVVLFAGAALNDQYLFYVSWADLFGSGATSTSNHTGGNARTAAVAKARGAGFGGFAVPAAYPSLPYPGSRLQSYTVTGAKSRNTGQVLVYLPAGYDPRSPRRYPVLLALHGFPGVPTSVLRTVHLMSIFDSLVAAHKIAPSIIVAPEIDTPRSLDTECVNDPVASGPQTETWLAHDIPRWVVAHFASRVERSGWAVLGYSMGGWCSAMVGMRHPDLFGAAIEFQGYFRPDFSSYDPISPGSATARGYDLVHLARVAPPSLAMWVLTTRTDSLSYPSTAQFLRYVHSPLAVTSVVLKTGGHRIDVFSPYIGTSLSWLGSILPGFAPTA